MSTPWKTALALALTASLVASPALAGGRHARHERRGHDQHSDSRAWRPPQRHHHHHRSDADDVALALGLTAVGLTAFALWAASQPASPAPAPPTRGTSVSAPPPPPVGWEDPDAGVTLVSEGYSDTGEFCREFEREIEVGGRVESGWGVACLQEDGSWRIVR